MKPLESTNSHCRRHGLSVSIDTEVVGAEFEKARGKALLDVCIAWNALDTSKRHRIKLPETSELCPDFKLSDEVVGYDSDAQSEESESGDESDAASE